MYIQLRVCATWTWRGVNFCGRLAESKSRSRGVCVRASGSSGIPHSVLPRFRVHKFLPSYNSFARVSSPRNYDTTGRFAYSPLYVPASAPSLFPSVRMRTFIYMYMCTFIHTYIYVCKYIYICMILIKKTIIYKHMYTYVCAHGCLNCASRIEQTFKSLADT